MFTIPHETLPDISYNSADFLLRALGFSETDDYLHLIKSIIKNFGLYGEIESAEQIHILRGSIENGQDWNDEHQFVTFVKDTDGNVHIYIHEEFLKAWDRKGLLSSALALAIAHEYIEYKLINEHKKNPAEAHDEVEAMGLSIIWLDKQVADGASNHEIQDRITQIVRNWLGKTEEDIVENTVNSAEIGSVNSGPDADAGSAGANLTPEDIMDMVRNAGNQEDKLLKVIEKIKNSPPILSSTKVNIKSVTEARKYINLIVRALIANIIPTSPDEQDRRLSIACAFVLEKITNGNMRILKANRNVHYKIVMPGDDTRQISKLPDFVPKNPTHQLRVVISAQQYLLTPANDKEVNRAPGLSETELVRLQQPGADNVSANASFSQPPDILLRELITEMKMALVALRTRPDGVVVFGSVRIDKESPLYKLSVELGEELHNAGYAIITGGGPSMSEGPMKGAGGKNTYAVNIVVRWEQKLNPFVENAITCKHFVTRKMILNNNTICAVCMPGGFGTMDELFDVRRLASP